MPKKPRKHVVVVGGGVGGLTVAHELMEKGYDVTILEADERCGGKAICDPRDGALFRDHSIKNFSAYYYCLLEQLKRIPYEPAIEEMDAARAAAKAAKKTYKKPTRVFDNLEGTDHVNLTMPDNTQYELNSTMGQSPVAVLRSLNELRERLDSYGLPKADFDSFIWKHARMLLMCKQRKLKTVDTLSYQEYLGFDVEKHPASKLIGQLVELTAAANVQGSAMVAAEQALRQFGRVINPHKMKTTTVSLNGPIDRTFIDPWVEFLQRERTRGNKGKVTIRTSTRVSTVLVDEEHARARGVVLEDGQQVLGDYTVVATSFAHLKTLVSASGLRDQVKVPELDTTRGEKWGHMCHYALSALPAGVQANTLYIVLGSPWAVIYVYYTRDFWPGFPEYFADAPVQLWVTTSCAVREGTNGKLYTQCLEDEFKDELLRQIYFKDADRHLITSSVVGRGLSWWNKQTQKRSPARSDGSDAGPPRPGDRVIAIDDTWDIVSDTTLYSPEVGMPPTPPVTGLTDLYIAGEVAETHQLVSTMEKANEAGKRVAHLICRRDGKKYDETRYVYHLPLRWVRRMDAFFYRLFCGACGCCCC